MRPLAAATAIGTHQAFMLLLAHHRIPVPEREFRFWPKRKFAFDYAWKAPMVALEVEGGVWTRGRHTRGKGYLTDLAKYNEASLLGWCLLRFTPDQLSHTTTVEAIQRALALPLRMHMGIVQLLP